MLGGQGFTRSIHSIKNAQFCSRFEADIPNMAGNVGIGCISDTESQPLIIRSHLGDYAITTVGRINNVQQLVKDALGKHGCARPSNCCTITVQRKFTCGWRARR